MSSHNYLVKPSRLEGEIVISGAKNSVLRLMAATLTTRDKVVIRNYPAEIGDAIVQKEMLEALGKTCSVCNDEIVITESGNIQSTLNWEDRSIRNTLLLLGALAARTGYGAVPLPGGCPLGDRKYDLHVMLLERFGARVFEKDGLLCAESEKPFQGCEIELPVRSSGATENTIICGCLAQGTTCLRNPLIRPEILDLIDMLRKMGAQIDVYGAERIEIRGTGELLGGCTHRTIPDNMEMV